jgi:hypothetical protein
MGLRAFDTSTLCGVCAGMMGERGLGLVVHIPSGCDKYSVAVTVTVAFSRGPGSCKMPEISMIHVSPLGQLLNCFSLPILGYANFGHTVAVPGHLF